MKLFKGDLMKYKIKNIEQVEASHDDTPYTVFNSELKNPVNGLGSASIPAETKEEAIEKLESLIKNHTVSSIEQPEL